MMRTILKSKIYHATITDAQLYYKGSITIDEQIMREADLYEKEKVEVLNLHNGSRLETYVIKGSSGSGIICLNGPAARMGHKGDKVVILSYGLYSEKELEQMKTKLVELSDENKIKNIQIV
ncbi:MAG: aspartate 1-decarboxylase [Candidatus Omnitrophota bacterium]